MGYDKVFSFFQNSKRYCKGLSFIEVIYSIVLMLGIMVLVSQFFSQSTQHLDRSKRYYLITQLLEQKMTELELLYQQEGPSALQEEIREPFEDHTHYSWSLEMVTLPNVPLVNIDEDGFERSNNITQILENISEKTSELVTEVRLTIHYKKLDQEASYSVTTYFIDFKKGTSENFLLSLLPQL